MTSLLAPRFVKNLRKVCYLTVRCDLMCFLNIDSGFWLVLGNARAVAGQWALGRAGILESGLDDGSGSSTLVQVAMLLVRCGRRGTVLLCGVRRAASERRQQKTTETGCTFRIQLNRARKTLHGTCLPLQQRLVKCCGISAASKPAQAGSRFVCAGSRFCGAASLGLLPSRVTATGQVTTAIGKQFISF